MNNLTFSIIAKLTSKGIEISIKDLIKRYTNIGLKKIKKKFIIKYKNPINPFYIEKKLYNLYKNENNEYIIIFPRFVCQKLLNLGIIDDIINCIQNTKHINMTYNGQSNENQTHIINYIFSNIYTPKNLNNGLCGLTLQLQAGYGKSFISMDIIGRIQKKTLIIVPNTYMLKQWIELLELYFPNNKIGKYYGKEKEDGDIVVGIINSLINDNFEFKIKKIVQIINKKGKIKNKIEKEIINYTYEEYYKNFGFVILDESHIYCTDSFKVIYNRLQSTYMLGLSATPNERLDKCDIISHVNIGEVLNAEEIKDYKKNDIKFLAKVRIIKYNGPDEFVQTHINKKTNMICVPQIIDDFINDPYRNKLIINELVNLFEQKLDIFVFSERRNHLELLYELFNEKVENKYKNHLSIPELNINKNIILYGNSTDEDIENAKNHANIIFTTYAYSSTGISINKLCAIILTTPRKSKSRQIIGRIFRLNKENIHIKRIIIDIVDNKSVLKNQFYSRKKTYIERECEFETEIINYQNIN